MEHTSLSQPVSENEIELIIKSLGRSLDKKEPELNGHDLWKIILHIHTIKSRLSQKEEECRMYRRLIECWSGKGKICEHNFNCVCLQKASDEAISQHQL